MSTSDTRDTRDTSDRSGTMPLADHMKQYEKAQALSLTRRVPVIIRVDGRAFHILTRGCRKPFDPEIMAAMVVATRELAQSMDGCVLAYTQSDEASFLLTDWARLETSPWFGYDLQKVVSLAAAGMTARYLRAQWEPNRSRPLVEFDARAFNIPVTDVANYFLWRAKDWHRNSVQMMAQAHFSPKELYGKKLPDIHEMLHGIGVNWATDTTAQERNGTFVGLPAGQSTPGALIGWTRFDVLPNYESVSAIVDSVIPKGETT